MIKLAKVMAALRLMAWIELPQPGYGVCHFSHYARKSKDHNPLSSLVCGAHSVRVVLRKRRSIIFNQGSSTVLMSSQ